MRGFEDQPIDWAPADVWVDTAGRCQQRLEFIVPGVPRPKGNVIKGRWGGYHDATKGLPDWSAVLSTQANSAMLGVWRRRECVQPIYALQLFDGPIELDITFVMPRPKTFTPPMWLKDSRSEFRAMFVDGMAPHVKKPDCDKCVRAVKDAFTGIVWHDDSQVVDVHAAKRYAYPGESTGAIISVTSDVWVT